MRTTADLQNRLKDELKQWYVKQCHDEYQDYYLYFLPTTKEHMGWIIISSDKPTQEYQLAMAKRINKGWTIEQNFNWIKNNILGQLPVMEY